MAAEILTSVTFEDGPSVGTLLADRDRLAAENARLREALGHVLALYTTDGYHSLTVPYVAATGDKEPPDTASSEVWLSWSRRASEWQVQIIAAARSLVEAPR